VSEGFSRRRLLTGIGAVGSTAALAGVASACGTGSGADAGADEPSSTDSNRTYPFYGAHQAGIVTPAQGRLVFASMNVLEGTSRGDLRDLLRSWSEAVARMSRGQLVGDDTDVDDPPLDTGEALGLPPSGLTVTLGYGPSLFDGRFGLSARRPTLLTDLPPLPNESLDPSYVGGDLCLQSCADDPLVAFHAVRNLARLGLGVVDMNWMELGFGRTSTTSADQSTPRNLLGFKDGTRNIKAEDADLVDRYVWVGEEDQPYMRGGSYLVARRIQIFMENWDRDALGDQQRTIGRVKGSGAPLTGGVEHTNPDFAARDDQGQPVIPARAHIRLASFEENGGARILRRGYSFTDGIDAERGTLLGGLFFLAYMRKPEQFIELQRKLGQHDALNEYIQHVGSAIFAVPGGVGRGGYWGDGLLT
jgi:deferrochelatase/peroxidase EfeB